VVEVTTRKAVAESPASAAKMASAKAACMAADKSAANMTSSQSAADMSAAESTTTHVTTPESAATTMSSRQGTRR
jgi:hypothetical protein